MPDASDPRGRPPLDWGDAFAALPAAAPPADAWSRLAARLDARAVPATHATPAEAEAAPAAGAARRRSRRPVARAAGWLGAGVAAALALVVAWPRHDAPPAPANPREPLAGSVASADIAPPPSRTPPAPTPASAPNSDAASIPTHDAGLAAGRNRPKRDATAIALPKAVEATRKPRLAMGTAPTPDAAPAGSSAPARSGASRLDALYAESARLEALLALARDDRVASAGAALIAAELDAQVAGIDAELAQPGLDAVRRKTLWQARVDTLRQAAGFESTQRVLAARGDVGALLVSVD